MTKKPKPLKNPEQLRNEANKILSSFELQIKALDDFTIPRDFFGFELIKRPNFNLPDSVKVHGFNNAHLNNLKLAPTVNVEFETLKTDIYKEASLIDENTDRLAKEKAPKLYRYYNKKTKERLIKCVKSKPFLRSLNFNYSFKAKTKKMNKRKKKELYKKRQESNDYDLQYKTYMSKVIDI